MSDDFDNLRPPDDDDDLPDWQTDESGEEGKSSSGDNLGFTGELNWRQDVDDAFNEQLDQSDDDKLDWQTDQPSEKASSGSSFGFTGELDWKKLRPDDESDDPDDALGADWLTEDADPSLLSAQDDEPELEVDLFAGLDEPEAEDDPVTSMNPAENDLFPEQDESPSDESTDDEEEDPFALPPMDDQSDDVDEEAPFALPPIESSDDGGDPLSWLQQYSAEDEAESPDVEPEASSQLPSWLDEADVPEEEPSIDDAPPWLQDVQTAEKPMSEGGKLSDDWLAGAENAPEAAASDMTFDQWQQIQDDITRPRDTDEEMPDLFSELGGELASDDLPTSETGELPSWVLGMDELDTSDAPAWFTGDEGQEIPPETAEEVPAAVANEDIFAELGLPSIETGYDFLDNPEVESAEDSPDWFQKAETEAEIDPNSPPDWLGELGDLSEMRVASQKDTGPLREIEEPDDDFFDNLTDLPEELPAEINPLDTSKLQDIDSLLASYEYQPPLPSTGELVAGSAELEKLFSDAEVESIEVKRRADHPGEISGLSPDAPDWLTELGASVEEVSAAAIVRKQTQREKPLDELSDRLQALHDRGLDDIPVAADIGSSDVLKSLLPGVNEVLSTTSINTSRTERTGDVVLTDAQRRKIDLLNTLVGTDANKPQGSGRLSAIDLTLATPNLDDMAGLDEPDFADSKAPSTSKAVSRASRRSRLPKFDRLLIALLLTLAVGLPFLSPLARIGDLPPTRFAAASRQQAVYDRVNAVGRGDLVLVAAEYGPTGAGELDTSLDALLRHILMQGARPVIVSGNAVGLLHARNILEEIAGDPAFLRTLDTPQIQAGRDYYVARYIAANAVGLRAFSEDIPRLLSVDVNGQPTGLHAESLHDFELIVIVAENAEDIRAWAEQVAPLAGHTLVAATGQSAAPLAEPYVMSEAPQRLSGLGGMLIGYRDAYTYRTMVDAGFSSPAVVPTETPLPTKTPLPLVETTAESEALTTDEPNSSPTASNGQSTATLQPSVTPSPTFTLTPTSTPTNTPSPTATQTPISTTAPGILIRAVVDASQAVNVREGPGRSFAPVGAAAPGAIVQVIGRNGDGQWIQIRLEDGSEGWIAAELLAIEEPVTVTPGGVPSPTVESLRNMDSAFVSLISDVNVVPMFQDEVTPEVTAEPTDQPAEATAESIVETDVEPLDSAVIAEALQTTTLYRDERWYGMTLGLVAIILIITVGMIVNILRGLFRRRNS